MASSILSLAEVEVYGTPVVIGKGDSIQNNAVGETDGNANAMSGKHSKEQEHDRYCTINGNNVSVLLCEIYSILNKEKSWSELLIYYNVLDASKRQRML